MKHFTSTCTLTALLVIMLVEVSCAQTCNTVYSNSLRRAKCDNRNLNQVPTDIAQDIHVIDLSGNNIVTLDETSFARYPRLQHIIIHNNRIQNIASQTFSSLQNLKFVYLDNNLLRTVPRMYFHKNTLDTLVLNNNKITKINSGDFTLSTVNTLSLEHNLISEVASDAFWGFLPRLKSLNLASNQLTTLKEATINHSDTSQLKTIRLYNNPWICDCNLRWLRKWLMAPDKIWEFGSKPQCAAPEYLANRLWSSIASTDFGCPPVISSPNKNTTKTAVINENVTFQCVITSDQQVSVLEWYINGERLSNATSANYETTSQKQNEMKMTSILTVTEVTLKDAGKYECLASNRAGKDQMSFQLMVSIPPTNHQLTTTTAPIKVESIAGIAAAVSLTLVIIIIVAAIFIHRWHRNKKAKQQDKQKPSDVVTNKDTESNDSIEKKPVNGYRTVQPDDSYHDPYYDNSSNSKIAANEQYRDYMDQNKGPYYPDNSYNYNPQSSYNEQNSYNVPQGSYNSPREDYYPPAQNVYPAQKLDNYYQRDPGYYPPNDGYTDMSDSYPPSDVPYYPGHEPHYPQGPGPHDRHHPSNPSIPSSEGPEPYYPDYIPANHDELRNVSGNSLGQGQGQSQYHPGMDYQPQHESQPHGRSTPVKPSRMYGAPSTSSLGSHPHHGNSLDDAIMEGTAV